MASPAPPTDTPTDRPAEVASARGHRRVRPWAALALGTLVALLLGELAARLLVPGPAAPDPDWTPYVQEGSQRNGVARLARLPGLSYVLQPGSRSAMVFPRGPGNVDVVEYEINRLGLRDHDHYEPQPPPGVQRVCVLGDSFTYGTGVDLEETWPKALERALAERLPGQRIEVLNCGVFNYNAREELEWLRQRVLALEPDLVLWCFMVNDVLTREEVETVVDAQGVERRVVSKTSRAHTWEQSLLARTGLKFRPGDPSVRVPETLTRTQALIHGLRRASRLFDLVAQRAYVALGQRHFVRSRQQQYEPDSEGWLEATGSLREARSLCAERGIAFHVTMIPEPTKRQEDYVFAPQHRQVLGFCEAELDAPFHDLLGVYGDHPPETMMAHPRDHHTSPLANELIAERLAEGLEAALRALQQ